MDGMEGVDELEGMETQDFASLQGGTKKAACR